LFRCRGVDSCSASFDPTIDYLVTKIPRFAFEEFPQAEPTLTTQMKSVGEAMAIGRTFKEACKMPPLAGDWPQRPGRRRQPKH
jgi:carbamoylphosphate synthase large subunit